MSRKELFGIPVDALTLNESLGVIENAIQEKKQLHHVVVNAAKIVNANKDEALKASIVDCDLINADGQAVVWASKLLSEPVPERVAGIDLMENLVELAHRKGYKIYFLGAKKEILDAVVEKYQHIYSSDIIAGCRDGYFEEDEEEQVARDINDSGAQILFVAISSPKKEIFLNRNKELLKNVNFIMGVGGSFDVVAGKTRRAPKWMQSMGMEWFYRLIQEPGRMWKRYLVTNTIFIFLTLKELLVSGRRGNSIMY